MLGEEQSHRQVMILIMSKSLSTCDLLSHCLTEVSQEMLHPDWSSLTGDYWDWQRPVNARVRESMSLFHKHKVNQKVEKSPVSTWTLLPCCSLWSLIGSEIQKFENFTLFFSLSSSSFPSNVELERDTLLKSLYLFGEVSLRPWKPLFSRLNTLTPGGWPTESSTRAVRALLKGTSCNLLITNSLL